MGIAGVLRRGQFRCIDSSVGNGVVGAGRIGGIPVVHEVWGPDRGSYSGKAEKVGWEKDRLESGSTGKGMTDQRSMRARLCLAGKGLRLTRITWCDILKPLESSPAVFHFIKN